VADPLIHAALDLDSSEWGTLAFGRPVETIEAWTQAEVIPALRRVEEAARGGRWAVGAVAYEAAPAFDPALRVAPADGPLLQFGLHDAPLVDPPAPDLDARLSGLAPDVSQARHGAAVAEIREAIAAGAVYQVNFTVRLRGRLEGDPLSLYRRLRLAQGGGDTAFLRFGHRAVVSASPELFLLRQGNRVTSRPMKGTARRGRWPAEDEEAGRRLGASEKDRAENVMIADLLRNDLGRVATVGSVRAAPLLEVERFRTVWQLTSTISGTLGPEAGLAELFAATFPCGSVTGAPKVAAMKLIAALEHAPRGIYCGAAGAVRPGGDCCFNVAIRTVGVDLGSGAAIYGTGGGITWDSDPAAEWDEALAKASVLDLDPAVPTLLETLRLEGGRVALLDGHLARLSGSARYHAIPLDLPAARARIEQEVGDARLRVLLSPDGRLDVERSALPVPLPGPVSVALSREPVDRGDPALFHKTTRRAPYERRRTERPDAFDVLLANRDGELTEATIANLVAELDGERVTPPLDAGLLPGVFRAHLLALGDVRERPLRVADLRRARRIWLVNALRGWNEARLIP
jgi:para-aminobenzoate synthetase / 4-amino-4-deoxychorismate lyase